MATYTQGKNVMTRDRESDQLAGWLRPLRDLHTEKPRNSSGVSVMPYMELIATEY